MACWRMRYFWIFPVTVHGKLLTNLTYRGALKWARCLRQNSRNSSTVADSPDFSLIHARTSSPNFGVGHADDRGLLDLGMLIEQLLDLAGSDVLAAANNHFLLSPGNADVAIGLLDAEVARVQPAFGVDRFGRLLGCL